MIRRHGTGVALVTLAMTLLPPVPAATPATPDACAEAARAPFGDVADGSTHAASVDCLVWLELARGVAHDHFGTDLAVSRAQVASFLDRLITLSAGALDDPADARFGDVAGVHAPAIERLAAGGVVAGRSTTRLEPHAPVRRDQLAAMVVRAHAVVLDTSPEERPPGDTPDDGEPAHGFGDLDGNVHAAAIARAVDLGLVSGRGTGVYDPAGATTRGQTALVLARLLDRFAVDGGAALTAPTPPTFQARATPIPPSLRSLMERWTWRVGCPVGIDELRLLEVVHLDLHDTRRWGALVVHHDVVDDLRRALEQLHDDDFPIARMEPIEHFRGDDDASMAANNTSGFNCRQVTGGTRFSEHSYGWAIDINPIQNPYVRGTTVLPGAGRAHLDRSDVRPGMLVRPGAVDVFDGIGWGWGGDYSSLKDYQHLSRTGW